MSSRLVSPRMMATLQRDFFPQRCALKSPTITRNTAGEEISTFAVRPGYEAIPCRVGPAGGGVRRTSQQTYLDATHAIVLSGQFRDADEEWKVELDGVEYDILLGTADPEGAITRLMVRIVK